MDDLHQLIMTFLNPIILVIAVVFVMNIIIRSGQKILYRDLLFGLTFSCAIVISMSDPIHLKGGGIFDMRGLLIGTATAFLGPRVGLIALCVGLAYRWSIGGDGLLAGTASMLLAFSAALLWKQYLSKHMTSFTAISLSLALFISFQNLALFLGPQDLWGYFFLTLAPYTLACNLLGTFFINYLINAEMDFHDQAKEMEVAATQDHLTGLLNRRSIEQRFPKMTDNTSITTLYFDIDHFKQINDTHGHAAGDMILCEISRRLSTTFRAEDSFARIGGDEFVVALPALSSTQAERVAERCRQLVANEPFAFEDQEISATISVGVAWSQHAQGYYKMLKVADQALYEAKASGRNSIAVRAHKPHDFLRYTAMAA